MLASPSAEQSAIASQLAAELVSYGLGLHQLLERQWEPELYRALAEQFDRMQMLVAALPPLAVTWTELLISRAELTHALWNLRAPTRINGRVEALHARHQAVAGELLELCGRYTRMRDRLSEPGAGPTPQGR